MTAEHTDTPRLKLLLIVPHPDDEVYGAGGTIMEFEEAGHSCGLVTLTRGNAGRNLGLCDTPEQLAEMREVELSACLDVLDITVHEQHSYPDRELKSCDLAELTEVAREAIERYQPEIVLTFPPNGSNGHPDHTTTHQAVKAAWDSLPEGERPALWYYAGTSAPEDDSLLPAWLPANLRRDVSRFVTRKLKAIGCHRTQALSSVDFIRKFPERITEETFYVVGQGDQGAAAHA
ncbi:PIG-L deacetylase family protein [Deinococcus sp. Marseille-Q6407]|uniref:PIG-L deacetylase family protein n=1 Tax=Deinococcus sp. Marseille-Q6407 TaxID=2969223 RepID=UPI0021BFBC7B|nr:PIG-L deacetylase family protein [Deinococcus sp. Marseille-Q6407]